MARVQLVLQFGVFGLECMEVPGGRQCPQSHRTGSRLVFKSSYASRCAPLANFSLLLPTLKASKHRSSALDVGVSVRNRHRLQGGCAQIFKPIQLRKIVHYARCVRDLKFLVTHD
jgi:hypothetical protein